MISAMIDTKAGTIPGSWTIARIGDIASLVTNGFVGTATPHYTDDEDGVTYIQGFNVRENRIDLGGVAKVNVDFHKSQPKSVLRTGDMLTVQSGHIGTTAVVDKTIAGANCHAVIITRFFQDIANPHFVAYYLNSPAGKKRMQELVVGSSVLHINTKDLRKFYIPLPSLAEQRKIAAILGVWDEAIAAAEQLIATLKERRRGLMQRLLAGRVRFPEFHGAPRPEEAIGSFLRESRILGSNGAVAQKITVKLYGKGVQPKQENQPGSEDTRYYRRKAGQFIYSKLDFLNGAFGIVPSELDGYESTLDLPAFDMSDEVNPAFFLAYVTRESFYKSHLGKARGGRKARRVPPSEFLSITIPLPSRQEQDRIAEVLNVCDVEIAAHEQQLSLLRQQKRGLMQRLLTGQVRVDAGAESAGHSRNDQV